MQRLRVGFALCGSFCTIPQVVPQVEELVREGCEVLPILSEITASTDTRFGVAAELVGQLETVTGKKVICTIRDAEPIGPRKMLDVLVIAPCTGNTLAKLAGGITDGAVTMAAKAHLRNDRPLVIAISTNDALGAAAQNIGKLLPRRNLYFVPYFQDDPEGKPASMVADMTRVCEAVRAAAESRQLRPVVTGGFAPAKLKQ